MVEIAGIHALAAVTRRIDFQVGGLILRFRAVLALLVILLAGFVPMAHADEFATDQDRLAAIRMRYLDRIRQDPGAEIMILNDARRRMGNVPDLESRISRIKDVLDTARRLSKAEYEQKRDYGCRLILDIMRGKPSH